MSMTLKQLAARLNEVIAENENSGRAERNDLPAMIRVSPPARKKGQRHRAPKFYGIDYASSHMTTFGSVNPVTKNYCKVSCMTLETKEENLYTVDAEPAAACTLNA